RELVLTALVGEVHRDVAEALGQGLPDVVAELVAPVLLDGFFHPRLELLVGLLGAGDAYDRELVREEPPERERVQRGEELLLRQVPGRPEDDDRARVRRAPELQPFEEGVFGDSRHQRRAVMRPPARRAWRGCPPAAPRTSRRTSARPPAPTS